MGQVGGLLHGQRRATRGHQGRGNPETDAQVQDDCSDDFWGWVVIPKPIGKGKSMTSQKWTDL
jgi:hypothetical protein